MNSPSNARSANATSKGFASDTLHYEEALNRFFGDVEDLADVANMFLDYAPGHIDALRLATDRSDHNTVRDTAHRLGGAAANLSAEAFVRSARRLETAARDDSENLQPLLHELELQFDQLKNAIQHLIGV